MRFLMHEKKATDPFISDAIKKLDGIISGIEQMQKDS